MKVKFIVEKYGEDLCSKNNHHVAIALGAIFHMLTTELNERSKARRVTDLKSFVALKHTMSRKADLIISESVAKYGPMSFYVKPGWFLNIAEKATDVIRGTEVVNSTPTT